VRIESFVAPTIGEALAKARQALGAGLAVLASGPAPDGTGVEVTVIAEAPAASPAAPAAAAATVSATSAAAAYAPPDPYPAIARALAWHGVAPGLTRRLTAAAAASGADSEALALAAALDANLAFAGLALDAARPLMLIGPPGAGKTIACAKLAARQALAGRGARVVTCDAIRAGGVAQLASFTEVLGIPLYVIEDAAEFADLADQGAPTVIDSPGVNPYNQPELDDLARFIAAAHAEPVLVLPAGGDAAEAADVARAFAHLGPRRLLATRLDAANRFGALLAAADAADLALAATSVSPFVGEGLHSINPLSLARLLLRPPLVAAETAAATGAARARHA
jgi:flagellar biosynthesis protein FlhF